MNGKPYTILILKAGSHRLRKLRVSQRGLVGAGTVLASVMLAAVFVLPITLQSRARGAALSRLATENRELMLAKQQLEASLDGIAAKLDRFEAEAGRLAEELGIDELASGRPPAGGPIASEGPAPQQVELTALSNRSSVLGESFDQLDRVFQDRMRMLASTPNRMPVEGWFSHGFGWRKDPWTGVREFHRGIDIVADQGTEILAPADGVVSRTARASDYGNVVDLSHGNGYKTRYAHLSKVLVKQGDQIKRGQVLGRVGSTGRSTGAHLHYEVFRDDRRVNPWKYLGRSG